MYQPYRLVWDPVQGTLTITPARAGYEAQLNNVAGQLLYEMNSDQSLFASFKSEFPAFFEECQSRGWISADGAINGSLTKIIQYPHLKRIQIELTRFCNLKCSYCYSMSGPSQRSKLVIEQVESILDDAVSLGCIWVDFTGGEPMLYSHWRQALHLARDRGMVVSLHSNGTLFNDDNLSYLASIDVRHIQVSVDSHIPSTHNLIRGSKGAFERTVHGIRLAKSHGLQVRATLMAHRGNKDHFRDTVKWFTEEMGVPVAMDRIIAAGGELEAHMGIPTDEYYELIAPLVKRNVSSTRICENQAASMPTSTNVEPHCGVAQSFVYITAEGEFALCPTMTSRDRPFFRGPNIEEMRLKTAWLDSPYFNQYRYVNCSNVERCPTAKTCGGGCRSNAYLESGSIDSPDLLSCNMHKNPTVTFVNFPERYNRGEFGLASPSHSA